MILSVDIKEETIYIRRINPIPTHPRKPEESRQQKWLQQRQNLVYKPEHPRRRLSGLRLKKIR